MHQSSKNTLAILIAFSCIVHAAHAAPQFVTFKDGNVGVNFGGYHAQAGLGGLLTGNAAHGGLSASAGVPGGPQAAAGLGGGIDGRASGNAYAGAQVNPSLGASAVLAGSAGEQGFVGAESHAPGKTTTHTISGSSMEPLAAEHQQNDDNMNTVVQKIKPSKRKHTLFKNQPQPQTESPLQLLETPSVTETTKISAKNVNHLAENADNMNNLTPNNGNTLTIVRQRHRQHAHRKEKGHRARVRQHIRQQIHNNFAATAHLSARAFSAAQTEQEQQAPISTEETTSMLHVKQIVKSYSHDNANLPAVYETHTSAPAAAVPLSVQAPAQASAAAQAPAQTAPQSSAQAATQTQAQAHAQAQAPAPAAPIPPAVAHKKTTVQYNGSDAVFHALNIPIGILRSLQESLGGFRLDKTVKA